jgi:autotransporter-associated beta strand protein
MKVWMRQTRVVLSAGLLTAFAAGTGRAGTFTWDGGGADNFWLTDANWNPDGAPASDGTATLAFSGNMRNAATNSFDADTVFAGITFLNDRSSGKTSAFTLSGNRLILGGNIGTTVPTVDGTLTDTIALPMLLNATRTVTANLNSAKIHNLTISGVIGETGGSQGLTKGGAGTLNLRGANTYSGITTVSAGILTFDTFKTVGGGASALGAPTTVENGTINAVGRMQYTGGSTTSDRIINLTGNLTFDNLTGGATITLNGGITGSGSFSFRGSGDFAVNGLIATGASGVSRTDKGTVYLNNPENSFSGALGISDGIISTADIADSGTPCGIGQGASISFGQTRYPTTGRLQFTGPAGGACNRALTVNTQYGIYGGMIENTVAGQTLTLSGNVTVATDNQYSPGGVVVAPLFLTGAGNGVLAGVLEPRLRVLKTGSGTWTLAGANANTGTVTVSEGTLLINGSTAAASAVSVAAGGTLGGTGTVSGLVAVAAGGRLAPGSAAAGVLTLANAGSAALTLAGGTLACGVTGAGAAARLDVAGTLVLNGACTLALDLPDGSAPAGTYTLATYAALNDDSGTLALDRTYPNATLTVGETGVTLTITGSGTAYDLLWRGDGSANLWDTGTDNWTPGLFGDGMAVVFDDTGSDTPAVDVASAGVAPHSVTIASAAKNFTFGGGSVAGSGSLTKSGASVLTLNNANSYGGVVALNGGSLIVNGALASAGLTVASGAVLTQNVAAALSGAGAALTVSGSAALLGTSTHTGATTVNTGGALVLGGVLDGSSLTVETNALFSQSAGSVIAGANVTLTLLSSASLGGSNTYGGVTTLGVLNTPNLAYTVNHSNALGSTAGGTRIYGGNGTTLSRLYLGRNITVAGEPLIISGDNSYRSGLSYNQTSGTGMWAGDIACIGAAYIESATAGGTLAIGADDTTVVTNAAACSISMRGNGYIALNSRVAVGTGNSLLRNDAGTLLINSTNNVWGGTGFSEGTLRLNVSDGLPVTTTLTIGKGDKKSLCVFDLNGRNQTLAGLADVHYSGTGDTTGTQRILSAAPATLTISNPSAYSFGKAGSSIEGAVSLVKAGNGTLTLTGTNSYSGATVVSSGTLTVSATGTLGVNSTNIVVAAGTLTLQNSGALADTATLSIAEGGAKVSLAAGVNEAVGYLFLGDMQKRVGTYGSTSSAATVKDDAHFEGPGMLTVLHDKSGTTITVR